MVSDTQSLSPSPLPDLDQLEGLPVRPVRPAPVHLHTIPREWEEAGERRESGRLATDRGVATEPRERNNWNTLVLLGITNTPEPSRRRVSVRSVLAVPVQTEVGEQLGSVLVEFIRHLGVRVGGLEHGPDVACQE